MKTKYTEFNFSRITRRHVY